MISGQRWTKHSFICSCITQDQDFSRALCSSRAALSCRGEWDWPLSLQQHWFQTSSTAAEHTARYVLWILSISPKRLLFTCDTQGCETPSRNKPRYANPIKLQFIADFQQPILPRGAFVLFVQLYGDSYWLQNFVQLFYVLGIWNLQFQKM